MAVKQRAIGRMNFLKNQVLSVMETGDKSVLKNISLAVNEALDFYREVLPQNIFPQYAKIYDNLIRALQNSMKDDASVSKKSLSLSEELLQRIVNDTESEQHFKKEIFFLPYQASMWDSLETVWKAACADSEHSMAYVMPIPYAELNPDRSVAKWNCDIDKFPKYVPLVDWTKINLKEIHPDIIFIHNAYDNTNLVTSVESRFYSQNLKECTDKLIYIPYSVEGEVQPGNVTIEDAIAHRALLPGVVNADLVVLQSEDMREAWINILMRHTNVKDRAYWESRILGLGSPKIDKVFTDKKEDYELPEKWKKLIEGKKIVLYNTSIGATLKNADNVCEKLRYVFDVFRNRDDVVLWWRPHPLMKSTLHSMRPQIEKEYLALEKQYIDEGWGIYDESPDVHRAVCYSDAYYGDASSVIELYRVTGKPVMIAHILSKDSAYMTPFHWNSVLLSKNHNEIFFKLPQINFLFDFDMVSGKSRRKIPLETVDFVNSFCGNGWNYILIQQADDKIFFHPWMTNILKIYHLDNDLVEDVPLKIFQEIKDAWSPNALLHGSAQIGRSIYFYCGFRNIIVVYNLDSGDIEYSTEYFKNIPSNFMFEKLTNKFARLNENCIIGSSFFVLLPDTNCILEFDTDNKETFFHYVGDESKHYVSIFSDGTCIWLGGNGNYVTQYSPKTKCKKEIKIKDQSMGEDIPYFVIYNSGYCILFPWNISPKSKNVVFINVETEEQVLHKCKHGYWLASLLPDGRILALDTYEKTIDVYDSLGNFWGEYSISMSDEIGNIWKQCFSNKKIPSYQLLEEFDVSLLDFIKYIPNSTEKSFGDICPKFGEKIYQTIAQGSG